MAYPGVQGRCPRGCGATLFLGAGGYVTCSWQHCPEPDAASKLLRGGELGLFGTNALLAELRDRGDLSLAIASLGTFTDSPRTNQAATAAVPETESPA